MPRAAPPCPAAASPSQGSCHAHLRHWEDCQRRRLVNRLPQGQRFQATWPGGPAPREDKHDDEEWVAPAFAATATTGEGDDVQDEQLQRELHSLNVAIGANILIFIAKAWVHLMTGGASILAEALHSVADILNQVLLRIGVRKSLQGPNAQYPYGYLRDRFVWSLISAVGIFFLGAGASVLHGFHSLASPQHAVEGVEWTYLVLGVSALLEGYSFWVAIQSIQIGATARGMSFFDYVKSGQDPTTVAVLMEDGGAMMGLAIAGLCTALSHATGSGVWDAVGSIGIGLLLGCIATFLVSKNRQLLIGRSMASNEIGDVLELLRRDPAVSYVLDTKTEEIGPRVFRFKAEVAWDGEALAKRYVQRIGRERLLARLRLAISPGSPPDALDNVLTGYGKGIISAVGAEVDRIEAEIQTLNPGIRYVDLETDRGRRAPPGSLSSLDGDFNDPGPMSIQPQAQQLQRDVAASRERIVALGYAAAMADADADARATAAIGTGAGVSNSGAAGGSAGAGAASGASSAVPDERSNAAGWRVEKKPL
ncbi:hypothetical protein FOA52_005080 [Chlamydomonas sp. UWO 241]|nr:hypothetical protein FOA52_005080 [Chlamydomonas sp. UWO 241]